MTKRRREPPHRDPRRAGDPGSSGEQPPRKPFPKDPRATFTLSKDLRSEALDEEIEILRRLSDAITERLGPDAEPAERVAAAEEIWDEDPKLSALASRLKVLMRTNPKSVARGLMELGMKEAEEEGRL